MRKAGAGGKDFQFYHLEKINSEPFPLTLPWTPFQKANTRYISSRKIKTNYPHSQAKNEEQKTWDLTRRKEIQDRKLTWSGVWKIKATQQASNGGPHTTASACTPPSRLSPAGRIYFRGPVPAASKGSTVGARFAQRSCGGGAGGALEASSPGRGREAATDSGPVLYGGQLHSTEQILQPQRCTRGTPDKMASFSGNNRSSVLSCLLLRKPIERQTHQDAH